MDKLYKEVKKELTEHILPFWMKLKDEQNGGMIGEVDFHLQKDKKADKGGIVTARFLWTFSAAYRVTGDAIYLAYADQLYHFLVDKVYDHKDLGLFWLLDYKGNPKDTSKHIYAQSFGVYALSEYYRASKNENALNLAIELFKLIEEKGFSEKRNAYMEEFDREWNAVSNEKLSENGVLAEITMNTHIHILEAYTNLYKAWPNEELKARLHHLLEIHYERIYDQKSKFLGVFFNENWESIADIKSFGHDIEASWLMDETIKTLELERKEYIDMVVDIAYNIADYAMEDNGSLMNEEVDGKVDRTKIWWVQAEAIVGFYNAYERTNDERFLQLVHSLWNYTKENIIDKREGGEWYWSVDDKGNPTERNICDPWKASYHNGRFCLEIMERMMENDS